jgi:hypothetical protein
MMSQIDYSALINGDEVAEQEPITYNLARSGDDDDWHYIYSPGEDDYLRVNHSDPNYSEIKLTKDIDVRGSQITVTAESYSQYIPFEMPRYYDGYDLTNTAISIHYVVKKGNQSYEAEAIPCNVQYNEKENKIRFGWLLDGGVTQFEGGVVDFEIIARGLITINNETHNYVWRTQPKLGGIKVLSSIGKGQPIKINDTWEKEIVDLFANSLITNNVATKKYVDDKIAEANFDIDLSDYYNKGAIENIASDLVMENGYILKFNFTNVQGKKVERTIDLPLESVVKDISYNDTTEKLIITLNNNETREVPMSALISDLATKNYVDQEIKKIDLAPYATTDSINKRFEELSYNDIKDTPEIPSIEGLATEEYVN